MRNKTNILFYLFYRFFIALIFFNAITIAQESPTEEFLFGASWHREYKSNSGFYNTFRTSGMNFLTQYADENSQGELRGLNFAAYNGERPDELIQYYSTAYYSKWEAEENQIDTLKVGFKHIVRVDDYTIDTVGSPATFLGRQCWSTEGLTEAADSLLYGPHYHQEKVYKRWYVDSLNYDRWNVTYTPRFSMALHLNDFNIDPESNVCRLYVRATYRDQINGVIEGGNKHHLLKEITLKVSDFAPYDTFKVFYLGSPDWYIYPEEFQDPHDGSNRRENPQAQGIHYFDRWGGQGVQFCIDWLRNDTKCDLYIDYIEVYDNDGGNVFADERELVIDNIIEYAGDFPEQEWPNMKYWGGPDEPSSLDHYTPMRIVDSVLNTIGAPRLFTKFYPWWEVEVNGDTQLVRYYNTVRPEKLFIDYFPFLDFRVPAGFEDWEGTREMFQICHSLQPGFYYMPQVFGTIKSGQWDVWRFPDTAEVKAQTMLALAHGVKGLINEAFTSLGAPPGDRWQGILNEDGTPFLSIDGSDSSHFAYKIIKENLVPRLKGKLGKTLMKLDYSGDFLQYRYSTPTFPNPEQVSYDYLILGYGPPQIDERNWHCGFFINPSQIDNEYFLLANLITTDNRCIKLTVRAPENTHHINYRFRNIEGIFDTTFDAPNSITKEIEYVPGEGYVYQVAPVVKYGGRLLYSDETLPGDTLYDTMVIEEGVRLTINGIYTANADIKVKNGIIEIGDDGEIHFGESKRLIVEGTCTIVGSPGNKLLLDFWESQEDEKTGITINAGGSLTITNCEIHDAAIGIESSLNANYLNAQYVDFINCGTHSINILGYSGGEQLPPPPPIIK